MKDSTVSAAVVLGICLVVSAFFLSSAIKDYGKSLERAALNQPLNPSSSVSIPANFTVSLTGGNVPLRFDVTNRP
jgi:hypothetical protein